MKKAHRTLRRRPFFAPLILPILGFIAVALALAWFFDSRSTTAIFLVRHAEKATMQGDDPGLNDLGRQRAEELARLVQFADVEEPIDNVFVSQYRRSMETAAPLIRETSMPVNEYRAEDSKALVRELLNNHRGKTVLVVAHSNTVGEIAGLLGSRQTLPAMTEDDYDDLYLITIPRFGKVQTLRFKYGSPTGEGAAHETAAE